MSHTSRWNRFLSLALCLGMILQSVAPAAAITLPPAPRAPMAAASTAAAPQLEPLATAANGTIQPDGLAQPLTVARTQASYAPAAALVAVVSDDEVSDADLDAHVEAFESAFEPADD